MRFFLPIALVAIGACATREYPLPSVAGLDRYIPTPDDNKLTAERVALGRTLFFDANLSADRRVSCASCHLMGRALADSVPTSRGVYGRMGVRNAPSLFNAAYRPSFFWD